MFGTNPIRPPEKGDGSILQIVEIFPTLQGEGPFAGHPAVFLRLGGCNLACSFCDTEFEAFGDRGLDEIVDEVLRLATFIPPPVGGRLGGGQTQSEDYQSNSSHRGSPHPSPPPMGEGIKIIRDLVVITGGEPLRQEIAPLCARLLAHGFRVQIETNGTLWRPLPEGVHVICSPKIAQGQYHTLRPDLLARVDAIKFIISADDAAYRDIAEIGQSAYRIPVYVQPMDSTDPARNQANQARALMLAQTHGYRLSLQTHKMLGIA